MSGSEDSNPEDSTIAGYVDEFVSDFINNPMQAQIEAQIAVQIEAQQSGSSRGRGGHSRRNIERERQGGHTRLMADYFNDNPIYTNKQFRRRYRMRKHVFHRIMQTLSEWSPYFCQRSDAFGRVGLSPFQKCTAAMRMLAYGCPADSLDENLRIGASTAIECLTKFVKGVRENFSEEFLRKPTDADVQRLLHIGSARGFPGMLGSLDCMHWHWEKCPTAWKGAFTRGDQGVSTIMLEAVASHDLWFWHALFGIAGSNNDINVLNQSTLFTQLLQGRAPEVQFEVNGNVYNLGYYLADGIYPEWATLMKSIPCAQNEKDVCYAKKQEGARKDVERAFGALQARFAIVRSPARMWDRGVLGDIMYACIILHNMIVEDERDDYEIRYDLEYEEDEDTVLPVTATHGDPIQDFHMVLQTDSAIRDRATHRQLKADLVEHIWQKFGGDAD